MQLLCELEFSWYPFDQHECMFRFGSPTEPNTLIYINSSLQNSLVAEVWGKLLCHFRIVIEVHFYEHSFIQGCRV